MAVGTGPPVDPFVQASQSRFPRPIDGGEGEPPALPSETLRCKVMRADAQMVVQASGDIDLANAHVFGMALDRVATSYLPLVVDLTNVHYMDSAGYHWLMRTHEQCRIKQIPFAVAATPLIQRILAMFALREVFGSVEAATDHVVHGGSASVAHRAGHEQRNPAKRRAG